MESLSEEKLLSPSRLALATPNCSYEPFFHDRQLVAPLPDDKKLIKRKILEQWRSGKVEAADFWWDLKNNKTLDECIQFHNQHPQYNNIISPNVFKSFNDRIGDSLPDNQFFLVPFFASKCSRKVPIEVPRTATPFTSLPQGWRWRGAVATHTNPPIQILSSAYMCINTFYTEYVLSLLFSDFYTQGKSIHFVPVEDTSFSTCLTILEQKEPNPKPPNISINQLFVMERIEGYPLWDVNAPDKRPLCPQYQNACLIQVLHSIAVYQKKSISHNDLHGGNIMIEQMMFSTRWNDQELINYDYFQYELEDNESLYLPFVPFIAKIIDFGLSCKYSEPQILNNKIMKGMIGTPVPLTNHKTNFHTVLIPPNWYFPAYDVLMFLINFGVFLFPENLLAQQILWIALCFSEEKSLPDETDAHKFYQDHNAKTVRSITGYNRLHQKPPLQIVLEDNVINSFKNLDAISLLQKCMKDTLLKTYTQPPPDAKKGIILGRVGESGDDSARRRLVTAPPTDVDSRQLEGVYALLAQQLGPENVAAFREVKVADESRPQVFLPAFLKEEEGEEEEEEEEEEEDEEEDEDEEGEVDYGDEDEDE